MRKVSRIFLTVVIFILAGTFSSAAVTEKEIIAEGVAAGGSRQSMESALNRALRNAIEQGVGVLIDSETMVENFELLEDRIYSQTKGYVKEYRIISDNKGEGGVYRIKVKARVALGALTKDVKALGIVREKMNYPRIMVLVNDHVDGIQKPGKIAATEIEKVFMRNKFPVVSGGQMGKIRSRDVSIALFDQKKAAVLGKRYGAEVVVVGQAESDLVDTSRPYGVSVYAYESRIEVKAVNTDNARILAIETAGGTARGGGRVPTANKALAAAADKVSRGLIKRIAEAWRSEIYNETSIQLICDNADFEKSKDLKDALSSVENVIDVNERSFADDILEIDVRFYGTSDQLASFLSELRKPLIKITGKTPNRIDIEFVK